MYWKSSSTTTRLLSWSASQKSAKATKKNGAQNTRPFQTQRNYQEYVLGNRGQSPIGLASLRSSQKRASCMKVLVGFTRKTTIVTTKTNGLMNGGMPRNELKGRHVKEKLIHGSKNRASCTCRGRPGRKGSTWRPERRPVPAGAARTGGCAGPVRRSARGSLPISAIPKHRDGPWSCSTVPCTFFVSRGEQDTGTNLDVEAHEEDEQGDEHRSTVETENDAPVVLAAVEDGRDHHRREEAHERAREEAHLSRTKHCYDVPVTFRWIDRDSLWVSSCPTCARPAAARGAASSPSAGRRPLRKTKRRLRLIRRVPEISEINKYRVRAWRSTRSRWVACPCPCWCKSGPFPRAPPATWPHPTSAPSKHDHVDEFQSNQLQIIIQWLLRLSSPHSCVTEWPFWVSNDLE